MMSRGHLENDEILTDLSLYWGLRGRTDNVTSSLGLALESNKRINNVKQMNTVKFNSDLLKIKAYASLLFSTLKVIQNIRGKISCPLSSMNTFPAL